MYIHNFVNTSIKIKNIIYNHEITGCVVLFVPVCVARVYRARLLHAVSDTSLISLSARNLIRGSDMQSYTGLARIIYIRCVYGVFGREITKNTAIYGVYIRFWPTLVIYDEYIGSGQP
jgi:hypothetical protein